LKADFSADWWHLARPARWSEIREARLRTAERVGVALARLMSDRLRYRKECLMDWTLEVVVLPVSDINRSIAFYRDQMGFRLDRETRNEHMHVAQLTPPGSGCSIVFGNLPSQNEMAPGSMTGLQLVVSNAVAARQALTDRGVEVSDLMVMAEADGGTFFGFRDPDGNSWAVQEIKARAGTPLIPKDHTGLGEWAGR
jgi:catechol 2,3-dioxygenase-like lactoylglutathione lyase family enzyme